VPHARPEKLQEALELLGKKVLIAVEDAVNRGLRLDKR
jgi:hypothetical protein